MLRNILMFLGLLVSFLPYLGFPYEWNRFVWTIAGLLIFFVVFFSRKGGVVPSLLREALHMQGASRALHVERSEVGISPEVYIEREVTIDTTPENDTEMFETVTEKKITVKRKHRKNSASHSGLVSEGEQIEVNHE